VKLHVGRKNHRSSNYVGCYVGSHLVDCERMAEEIKRVNWVKIEKRLMTSPSERIYDISDDKR
jgi:thiazole synthase ThiGH ThiG subunit